jgi:serine/threonine-protein kinase
VLYEMLTGDVPFSADTQVGVAMKHVNEELPDVQRRRPGLSAAAALTIERATTKDPAKRYKSIREMIDDLETALEVEAARAGSTEGEATTVLKAVRPRRRWLRGNWRSLAGVLAVLALAGGAIAAVMLISSGNVGGGGIEASASKVKLASAGDFDPSPGDLSEDPEDVDLVRDGNPTTSWVTDHYDSPDWGGIKPGVGIYVRTARPVKAQQMEVRTSTRGWDAVVYAFNGSPPGTLSGWEPPIGTVSNARSRQIIRLHPHKPADEYLLWLTEASEASDQLGRYQVAIGEIKLTR